MTDHESKALRPGDRVRLDLNRRSYVGHRSVSHRTYGWVLESEEETVLIRWDADERTLDLVFGLPKEHRCRRGGLWHIRKLNGGCGAVEDWLKWTSFGSE